MLQEVQVQLDRLGHGAESARAHPSQLAKQLVDDDGELVMKEVPEAPPKTLGPNQPKPSKKEK